MLNEVKHDISGNSADESVLFAREN